MRYMILIYSPQDAANETAEDLAASMPRWLAYSDMLRQRNAYVSAGPLATPADATTLRVTNGKTVAQNGPFAQTDQWLAGYYIIDAASLDEALEYAKQCPGLSPSNAIEVRAILDVS